MSNLPFQQKQAANMEMQERPQNMGWPLMNGATHHSLPPIAAITSCRPSSTPVQLLRNTKDDHVFTAPGQLRQPQPTTARAPTPFPDLPPQRSLGFPANPDNAPSPKLSSVPTKSAFAVVGSQFSPKEGAISSPIQELKSPGAETVGECNSSELGTENNVTPYQSQSLNSLEYPKASQENSTLKQNHFSSIGNNSEQIQGEQSSSDGPLTNQRSVGFPLNTKPTSNYPVTENSSSKSAENVVTVREINVKAQDSDFVNITVVNSNIPPTSSGNTTQGGENVTPVNMPPSSGEIVATVNTNISTKSIDPIAPANISPRGVENASCVKTIMSPKRDENVAADNAPSRSVEHIPPVNENMPSRTIVSPVNANLPPKSTETSTPININITPRGAENIALNTNERHGHLYTSMNNSDKPTHHNMNSYNNLGPFERKSETAMQMANAAYLDAVSRQGSNTATTSAVGSDVSRQTSDSLSKPPISVGHSAYFEANRPSVVSQHASSDAASRQSTNGANLISAIRPPTPATSSNFDVGNRQTSTGNDASSDVASRQSTPIGNAGHFDAAIRQHFSAGNSPFLNAAGRQPAPSGNPDHYNPASRQPTPTSNSGHFSQSGLTVNTPYTDAASRHPSPSAAHFDSASRHPTPTGNTVPFSAASRQPSLTGNAAYYDVVSRQPTPTRDTGHFDGARRLPTPTGSVGHFDATSRQPTPTGNVGHFDSSSRQPTPTGSVGHFDSTSRQPTPTGSLGHFDSTRRQPTPTGNVPQFRVSGRQPTPTGNSGHYEGASRQPTPTGNSGHFDTASKQPNPSGNIGQFDTSSRQPTPTGSVNYLIAANRQPTPTGNTGHFDAGNRQPTPTGNTGHFDAASRQPTPTGNSGHFDAARRQPTPSGNTGHFDAASRQPTPTGNTGHFDAARRQPTPSGNTGHFDAASRQPTPTGNTGYFDAASGQPTSTGNVTHFNTANRHQASTGNAGHFDTTGKPPTSAANVGHFIATSKQPTSTNNTGHYDAGSRQLNPTGNVAHYNSAGRQVNLTGGRNATHFDAAGKQLTHMGNAAHFNTDSRQQTPTGNAAHFDATSRQPTNIGSAARFDATKRQLPIATSAAGNVSLAGSKQASASSSANFEAGGKHKSVSIPTSVINTAYFETMGKQTNQSANTAAFLDVLGKQASAANTAHFGVANKTTAATANSYFDGRGAYFDAISKHSATPTSQAAYLAVANKQSSMPTTSSSGAYSSVANQANAAASAVSAAYFEAASKQGINVSSGAYFDDVNKQKNLPLSHPYRYPVPGEYSHRPTGPRAQFPSQYHRDMANRSNVPNIRQTFVDNRQLESMRQTEKSGHPQAQVANYPVTPHGDQHSIIRTANPLHHATSLPGNTFNSSAYSKQNPAHTMVSSTDRTQNRQIDRVSQEAAQRQTNYTSKTSQMVDGKYYNTPHTNTPNTPQNYKRPEPSNYPAHQQMSRQNMQSFAPPSQTKNNTAPHPSRPQQANQYYPMETSKQTWNVPQSNEVRTHGAVAPFTSKEVQVQSPLGAAQMHRSSTSHSQAYQSQINSRDRHHTYQQPSVLPRINPPAMVSLSSHSSSRFSPHSSNTPTSLADHGPSTSPFSRLPSTSHSSSYSPTLPRVNFPSPVSASFTGVPARSECVTTVNSRMPISSSQYNQAYGKVQQGPSTQSRHANSKMYPGQQLQETGSYTSPYGRQTPETSFQQNTQVISRGNDSDVCRNPFELPVPTSNEKRLMKLNERHPSLPYNASPNDPKSMPPNSTNNYIPRPPVETYPNAEMRKKMAANAMFVPHNMFEQHQESKASSTRPKQTVVSARFPPVPQSNFDLQRQIYDRMTGVQQAPPRLIAKQEKHQQVKNVPLAVPKRESPLDLSVKTVRQSADSTRDDVEMMSQRQPVREPRLASAPKIDFTPNFSDPLVRPGSQNATMFLPPVHSIRKFQPPAPSQTPPKVLKRPLSESPTQIMAKIPKVDAWKVAMDEQIEERLKAARQMRHQEPLPPPPISSSPAYDMPHEFKRENIKMGLPEATPEHIIQQISQGVVPDTRFLQDRKVVDMLRTSLEEKEARLEALQAAARKRPAAERMCVPPSFPLPPPLSAQPIPIGVQSTQKFMRSPESDLDGLAALAARIRTKAEMKQMGPTRDNLSDAAPIPITSPPKLLRENRPSSEPQAAPLPAPRDPTGLRSSSETSVFDFRETDSENEMPVLERQTLDGMRRPRKTQPPPPSIHSTESDAAAPDPAWENACDMFVEQLQKRPIKRSVRKKKPNPKFFTNESDTPQYMKVPVPDEFQVKQEPEESPDLPMTEVNEDKTVIETTPSKAVKQDNDESSSDDELPGVTVVKEGRIKLITRKQKPVASDSEWDSSVAELTSADESEASGSSSESSSEENSDKETRKTRSESNERTRPTRKCRTQGSDSDSAVRKRLRTRAVVASDSDSQSKTKIARPRTRTHPISESDDQEESSEESEDERIRTRQQARSVRDSGRMRLRSKKGDAAFRPGWEEDVVKFKQQLRMPDRLISKPKKKESPKKTKNKSLKVEKEEVHSTLSRRGRFGGNMVSAGMRRSNKAVSNSKKHLNKGSKRMKLRRRFRSGLDYLRRKKKQVQKKEKEAEVAASPVATPAPEPKRRVRAEAPDVSVEVKGWVVNKSAGETVLHRAARLGHADVAAYCLETRRMEPSPRDHAGYTPLHEACSRGHVEVAKLLLEYGASAAESVRGGVRPLHQAAENNHLEMVRLLLAYGADPQLATYTGQTALTLSSSQDIRDLILTHLSDIHGEESYKWTFEGPASVFDPNWAVDPLANPPSPDLDADDVELEVSRAMLPPLYRLQSDDTWVLLSDVMTYMEVTSEEQLMNRLPGTPRTCLSRQEFLEHAKPCNILSSGPTTPAFAKNVTLLRYDDAVRKLMDVEVAVVS